MNDVIASKKLQISDLLLNVIYNCELTIKSTDIIIIRDNNAVVKPSAVLRLPKTGPNMDMFLAIEYLTVTIKRVKIPPNKAATVVQ
jgi:hypothetical protein